MSVKEIWPNVKDDGTWYEPTNSNDFFKPEPGPAMKELIQRRDPSDWPTGK